MVEFEANGYDSVGVGCCPEFRRWVSPEDSKSDDDDSLSELPSDDELSEERGCSACCAVSTSITLFTEGSKQTELYSATSPLLPEIVLHSTSPEIVG